MTFYLQSILLEASDLMKVTFTFIYNSSIALPPGIVKRNFAKISNPKTCSRVLEKKSIKTKGYINQKNPEKSRKTLSFEEATS
jgi:hypothetical protein